MNLHLFEATNHANWGKFAVGLPGPEWRWRSELEGAVATGPLLTQLGWSHNHVWVMDLQTGEGAIFAHGGNAGADLNKHRIWVCPLFEPFLAWLYRQDLTTLATLPQVVELLDVPFIWHGYRRPGPDSEAHQ
jgi:hypothetical protein